MSQQLTSIILTDFEENWLYYGLKNKFTLQMKGLVLWERNKESTLKEKHFLPIEYSKDKEFIRKLAKACGSRDYRSNQFFDLYFASSILPKFLFESFEFVEELKKYKVRGLNTYTQHHLDLDYKMKYNSKDPELKKLVLQKIKKNGNDLQKYRHYNDDKEVVMEAIRQNGNGLYYADVKFRNDREAVRESMKINQHTFYYMSEELKKDRSLSLEAVTLIPGSIRYAADSIKSDRSFILEAVLLNGRVLQYVDKAFTKDREIVENAVSQYGYAIKFAAEEFQKDESLIFSAIRKAYKLDSTTEVSDELILKYVKEHNGGYLVMQLERFCNVKEVILGALENNGSRWNDSNRNETPFVLDFLKDNFKIFEIAHENIRNEPQVYTKAFDLNCIILEDSLDMVNEILNYRNKILDLSPVGGKLDKNIAIKVVRQNYIISSRMIIAGLEDQIKEYLQHFRNDRDVILYATRLNWDYFSFASDVLKDDFDFMIKYAIQRGYTSDASNRLKADPKFQLRVLEFAIDLEAPKELRANRDFMIQAVQKGNHLRHATNDLKNDKEVVLAAIKGHYSNISSASKNLQKDREFILKVLKIDGQCLQYLSKSFQEDRELILAAAQSKNPYIDFEKCSELFPTDRQVMMECTKLHGYEMIPRQMWLNEEFRLDPEFMFQVAASNSAAAMDTFESFGHDKDFTTRLALTYGLVQSFDEDTYRKRIELAYYGAKLPLID